MATRPALVSLAVFLALAAGCSPKDPPAPAPASSAGASSPPSSASATIPASAHTAEAPASASVDAVSHASAPYEPGPSVIASGGSVDGAALRKRHADRLRRDTSPVTVLRGEGP